MRRPAKIREYMDEEGMFGWLQQAPDRGAYGRRMAIWLTRTGKLHAYEVAGLLGVSEGAVWLWIRQYNEGGPAGLERQGRGGRRKAFLSWEQEENLLWKLAQRAQSGYIPTAREIQQTIRLQTGRKVSVSYVYRLLRRHRWPTMVARYRQRPPAIELPDNFVKSARPWLRQT